MYYESDGNGGTGRELVFVIMGSLEAELIPKLPAFDGAAAQAAFKEIMYSGVGKAIAVYLPVYYVWVVIAAFLFPFLFGVE